MKRKSKSPAKKINDLDWATFRDEFKAYKECPSKFIRFQESQFGVREQKI